MRNWNRIGAAVVAFALVMPAGLAMAGSKDHDGEDHQTRVFISSGDGSDHANVKIVEMGEKGSWTVDSDRPFLGVVLTHTEKNGEAGAGLMQIVPDSPGIRLATVLALPIVI